MSATNNCLPTSALPIDVEKPPKLIDINPGANAFPWTMPRFSATLPRPLLSNPRSITMRLSQTRASFTSDGLKTCVRFTDACLKRSRIRCGENQRLGHVDGNVLPAIRVARGEVVAAGELGVEFHIALIGVYMAI